MLDIQKLLAVSIGCLLGQGALFGQAGATPAAPGGGGGSYFQVLVRDAKTRIREIGPVELGRLRESRPGLVLVDVREDNEWNKSRISGAIHVGRGVLEIQIESRIPQRATPLVLYCRAGARSAVAADVLLKMGYTEVWSLAGGLTAFEAAGMAVDRSAPAN